MRVLAGLLLIVAAGFQIALGATLVLASRYEERMAVETKALEKGEGLASVMGDDPLFSDTERAVEKEKARKIEKEVGPVGTGRLALGVALLALAALQLAGAVLHFLKRARLPVLILTAAAAAVVTVVVVLERYYWGGVAAGALALSFVLAVLHRTPGRARPTPADG